MQHAAEEASSSAGRAAESPAAAESSAAAETSAAAKSASSAWTGHNTHPLSELFG